MGALLAAYVAVWLGVSLFVARLAVTQRHLDARLDALASQIEQQTPANNSVARAA
jgi:CcmD family protein